MKSVSIWHPILTIIGMAAWALFILGCIDWSSWSPDGSKIVFPYVTAASNHRNWGLALYDSNGRTVTPIFIQPVDEHEKHNKVELMQAQWTSDGSRVLINLIRETELEFLVLNVRRGIPLHHMTLPVKEDSEMSSGPFAEIGNSIYFSAGRSLVRLSLTSGTFDTHDFDGNPRVLPFISHGELLYVKQQNADTPPTEFGTINRFDLTLHPLFEVTGDDFVPNIPLRVAVDPTGRQFAMIGSTEDNENGALLLFTREGLQQTIIPRGLAAHVRFGNLQWAKDGTSIYAIVVSPTGDTREDKEVWQCSLVELNLTGNPLSITPLLRIAGPESDPESMLEISLSPNGTTIALGAMMFGPPEIDEKDRVLFLIDVRGSDRQILRIPPPKSEEGENFLKSN